MALMKYVEYQCTWCGKRVTRAEGAGKPLPGKCPRKTGDKPHTWIVNRKF